MTLTPQVEAIVRSIARSMAEEDARGVPLPPSATSIEVRGARKARARKEDGTAIRAAIEAAIAAELPPIRAELFADGRIVLHFAGAQPPELTQQWRELIEVHPLLGGPTSSS